jgi:hypothetical protein
MALRTWSREVSWDGEAVTTWGLGAEPAVKPEPSMAPTAATPPIATAAVPTRLRENKR